MYLGMGLVSLGTALAFSSLAGTALTLAAVAAIDRWVITREEAYLTRRFGEDYVTYTRQVRRWL
jgi:protein-S-isoprenylcysteine O-methyltransferase Ste14